MPRSPRYPERLLPSKLIRQAWADRARQWEDRGYSTRWLAFWKKSLDICRAQGTWDDRDVDLLAEFVEWSRLAEDHRREAELDPYQKHEESGRIFAHPGFAQARDARREARAVAEQLCLTPEARERAGIYDDDPDDGGDSDQAGL